MAESRFLPIPDGLVGERVDTALARMVGISRTRAGELAEEGYVLVDGGTVLKSARLAAGAILDVTIPEDKPVEVVPTPVEGFEIVYEDADIVVVDKPVGVAAHASPSWEGPTVLGALLASGRQITTSGAAERQGIVQRLDVGTSGLMVIAASEMAYSILKQAFRDRTPRKVYHALAQGHLDSAAGTIDAPIGRHPGADWKMAVRSDGRESVTHYETVEMMKRATLLEIVLETGRTHQIRVHLQAIGHPCVGDLMYGADPTLARATGLTRQWLHATELGIEHPRSREWMTFHSPYPADLTHALEVLR